jgi:hypothetical protein
MALDFVSLVPAGDDPMAQVVISKTAPDSDQQEDLMGSENEDQNQQISKDDLAPEVVAYIDGLEEEVETLSKQVEKSEEDLAAKDEQIAKMAPKDDDSAEEISKSLLEKADPAVRALIEKQQADLKRVEEVAKQERDARLDREFISKAEQMPMLSTDKTALGGLLRRVSDALSPEDATEVEKILKAANAQIAEGNIFKTIGNGGADTTVSASVEAAAEEIRKADPTLTKEQAVAKAFEVNPALLTEAMTNKEG